MTSGWFFRYLAICRALSEWRLCLSGRSSSPCRNRNALKGLSAGPRSLSSWTRTLKMKATFPSAGKLPKASQYFTPW